MIPWKFILSIFLAIIPGAYAIEKESPYITEKHRQEIERIEQINWDLFASINHLGKNEFRYGSKPCYKGCSLINKSRNPSEQERRLSSRFPPGSLSLVIPWCCEYLSFILRNINFRGVLKAIYIYDKCSRTGFHAKDLEHVNEEKRKGMTDQHCKQPTPLSLLGEIGENKLEDVKNIEIRIIDANEPGRSSCMSTDECGAYLRHLTSSFDDLTDGVFFMQPDQRHSPAPSIQQIVDWTYQNGIAPIGFIPLGDNGQGHMFPVVGQQYHEQEARVQECLELWQGTLFNGETVSTIRRSGAYKNGIFYVSRLVVLQRPLVFWQQVHEIVNRTQMCASVVPTRHGLCVPENHRPFVVNPPSETFCKAGVGICFHSCNTLQHVWGQFFCQPCHNLRKDVDPRFPWVNFSDVSELLLHDEKEESACKGCDVREKGARHPAEGSPHLNVKKLHKKMPHHLH